MHKILKISWIRPTKHFKPWLKERCCSHKTGDKCVCLICSFVSCGTTHHTAGRKRRQIPQLLLMWILDPAAGLPRRLTIIPHQSRQPWCGFGGHDGAEPLISRTVTSETHFPTIKEREKLSGPTQAVSTALSQTLVCVWVCELNLQPQSEMFTHTCVFPILCGNKAFPNVLNPKDSQRRKVDCDSFNHEPN